MEQFDLVNDAVAISTTDPFRAQNSVTSIAQHVATVSGGTYTLTVTIPSIDGKGTAVTYTTAGIAYNATAATMEAALDTASPATVTDGHLVVAEAGAAGLSDGACTFTASGADIAAMPVFVTIDGASLTGGGTAGAVTQSTYGQASQVSKKALFDMNVVSGTRNEVGSAPSDWVKPASNGQSRPRAAMIKKLALDCTDVDGDSLVWDAVLALYPHIANV
jgi:hypothetical protein